MMQEHDSEGGIVDILIGVGLLAAAVCLYMNDPRGGDDGDDGPDDLSSSYPPEEDAMNHRYPGSYGSRTGG